jgi:hypothetical protein
MQYQTLDGQSAVTWLYIDHILHDVIQTCTGLDLENCFRNVTRALITIDTVEYIASWFLSISFRAALLRGLSSPEEAHVGTTTES